MFVWLLLVSCILLKTRSACARSPGAGEQALLPQHCRKKKGERLRVIQLLKLVLAKLGNDDSDSNEAVSDNEVNGASSSRPKRSHVAPHAAFPPVKRRTKGRAQVTHSSPTVILTPGQSPMPESLVPSTGVAPEQHVGGGSASVTPGLGVADVLADIRKSLASLSASSMVPVVPKSPLPVIPASAALPLVPLTPQVPAQATQAQDPTSQALVISRLLATIKVPASGPPPTTPWNLNDSVQGTVAELKRQVDVLAMARNVMTWQAAASSVSVSPAPGAVTPAAPLEKDRLNETNTAPAKVNSLSEGSGIDALLSQPVMLEKKPDLGIAMICYSNKILKSHHVYVGAAWLEYNRDFRWAKLEDPSIGWDQTEVNVWL
ncbi:hypothetical protein NDU88_003444 [Pleurodeles waltl]|uniref:Uncharacterized protein n=1 Tax=Pleurodeles waltl TaxID=8319 RepID=A0AAV7UCJ7_PLEWA|nr:hypothetical protein NDU88_003444 [Pleurodeles waltl]